MGHKLAIDFGTTNTVAARWDEAAAAARLIDIPGASNPSSIVPSLLYVEDGQSGQASLGQVARDADLVRRKGHRLFRNFKRGIVAPPSPDARLIDGALWTDHDAGRVFLRRLIAALPYPAAEIDQLVLTAPVASFESYLVWLTEAIDPSLALLMPGRIPRQIVVDDCVEELLQVDPFGQAVSADEHVFI